jgi:hypothetical protein
VAKINKKETGLHSTFWYPKELKRNGRLHRQGWIRRRNN